MKKKRDVREVGGGKLRGVEPHDAELHGVKPHGAEPYGTELRGVELRGADPYGTELHGAESRGAELRGAELSERELSGNRQYKDTVFRMLFRDKKELLSLYNAMNGSHYTDPEQLKIVTLENAVYMSMKNDLAFLADFHLYLYEHQSTVNPNIPLRFLQYVAKEYEKLIAGELVYGRKRLMLVYSTMKLPKKSVRIPHFQQGNFPIKCGTY